jgi:hypothetical protein
VRGQPEQDDGEAGEDVDDVVVCRQDDRCSHRDRTGDGKHSEEDARGRTPDGDAGEHVPPEVKAGERRVLVGQPGWLKSPVRMRVECDGVDERGIGEPGWGDGEEGEEEEPDPARDEDRVAKQQVAVAASAEEDDGDRDDHRPVAPDVDPVDEVGQ